MRCVNISSVMVMSPREENSEEMYECVRDYAQVLVLVKLSSRKLEAVENLLEFVDTRS